MSNKPKHPPARSTVTNVIAAKNRAGSAPVAFTVRRPLLWLALVALIVYLPTFSFGFTDLDDGIFINDFHEFNDHIANIVTAFHRSVLGVNADIYYRPVFLISMILNNLVSGQNIMGYHVVNVLIHITAVLLLYKLFLKLNVKDLHAFILTLLFAVHPLTVETVTWIPGRDDMLLAIFTFSFLICSVNFAGNGRVKQLLLSMLFLLLALFSKETAVFIPVVAFVLIVLALQHKWLSRSLLIMYPAWGGCLLLWFLARWNAIGTNGTMPPLNHDLLRKAPVIIQYLGKIFLPFNLSVFPLQQDTVYYFGFCSLLLFAALLYFSTQRDTHKISSGILIFLLFLTPTLLVPDYISRQTYEYRLYLPLTGILLTLSQTAFLQNKLPDKTVAVMGISVAVLLAGINLAYQRNFENPLAFWTQAAYTSPHSAEANMRLAARVEDQQQANELFMKAFSLNPHEKKLNFIYGVMLQSKDSILASEKYFLTEKKLSGYPECDYYLARVAMEKKDLRGAITFLETFLKTEPKHALAHNNLLFLYIDTQQPEKAKALVTQMRALGLEIPPEALKELK